MTSGAVIVTVVALVHVVGAAVDYVPDTAYVQRDARRMVVVREDDEDCDIVGSVQTIVNAFFAFVSGADNKTLPLGLEYDRVVFVDAEEMRSVMSYCDKVHAKVLQDDEDYAYLTNTLWDEDPWRRKDASKSNSLWSLNPFNRILILPGTKWCGQGDVAEHYYDLGYHAETDKCCREHDLCLTITGEYLSPGECKNGLCNYSPVTRSPCHCDRQFVNCLRSVKTRMADALGRIFFNIAGMTCYEYDHPVKRCVEYVDPPKNRLPPWILSATHINTDPKRPRCKSYELDTTKPKAWQFFETFYEETNQRSEEPRYKERRRRRRQKKLPIAQKVMLDLILKVVGPD